MRAVVATRLRGLPVEDQQDALAEAALALLDRLDSPEPVRNVEAYAVTVATNACHRTLRRKSWQHRLVHRLRSWTDAETGEVDLPAPALDLEALLDTRALLGRLWTEIVALPLRQRIALLLNLRDDGGDGLSLAPLLGIAGMREIAEQLEMPALELAALWSRLPLSDDEIAQRLSVSRQQVVNLRKSARARLARRMRRTVALPRGAGAEATPEVEP